MAETPIDETAERHSAAARLFDVRRVIGGLFFVYGVIVTVIGIFDSDADLEKAQGVRINLWTGLGMLALGSLFLLWQWWRPARAPAPPPEGEDDRPRHWPPAGPGRATPGSTSSPCPATSSPPAPGTCARSLAAFSR